MAKPLVVVAAPVTTRSGYGAHSRDICNALIASDKYDVRIAPVPWGNTPTNALPADSVIAKHIMQGGTLERQPDVFIHITIPNEFSPNGKFNIGITAGIETDACDPEWIEGCNRMDLVIATSQHSRKVFTDSEIHKKDAQTGQTTQVIRMTKPCEVLFEGIDTAIYSKQAEKDPVITEHLDSIKQDFAFLFVGHWLQGGLGHDRKDVGMLIRTFLLAFAGVPASKKPALILKTSGAGFSEIEKTEILAKIDMITSQVRAEVGRDDLPKIYLIHGDLTDQQINTLYQHPKVKAMVSFTKGEGFGRPLLEFCTTGKPILASNWSGHVDFLNPETSILLPGTIAPVHSSTVNKWIIKDSKWFTVDYAIAMAAMKDVFNHYDKYLQKSKKTIHEVQANWTFDKMQQKLIELIDRGVQPIEQPKIILPTLRKL